ncbi:MAG: cytochrome c oxidase subunit 3 [Bacteriovoracales bacterium]|nr:cytochrome c oxidase subunit 3 [Bacteriovoracales bacterium]
MEGLKTVDCYGDRGREIASDIAMTLALISFAMLFLALMLCYAIFRFNATVWPPMGMERIDPFYPVLSTTLMAASSVTFEVFSARLKKGKGNLGFLALTLLLGLGFLGSQALLWKGLLASGLYVGSGIFPSLIYGLTWIHGGHLALALLFLALLFIKRTGPWVKNVGLFWHFLGVVWFVLYLALFVF